jgi:hypothetical protein
MQFLKFVVTWLVVICAWAFIMVLTGYDPPPLDHLPIEYYTQIPCWQNGQPCHSQQKARSE